MTTVEGSTIKTEVSLIPTWAVILAGIIFISIPGIFWMFVWPNEGDYPRVMRILLPMVPATLLAFLVLMIGYVNRDAGRRGMSRTLWTIIVIFVPNAIGFILYFLLRQPLQTPCPKCGTKVNPTANYCPKCRYSFHPTCPQCKSPVRSADTFCANCGSQLS
jgi:Double zinc ribbon/Phospholipase_D-nuclease N-terminal